MGHLEILNEIPSHAEGITRTVRIYLPERYLHSPDEHFGVIYMHDGQNVFEHPASARFPTWAADLTLERLQYEGRIGSWLIVAVDHSPARFEEYSPWDEPRHKARGRAEYYARFLVEELKPWVDSNLRTLGDPAHTATAGSSLGGLISLYLALKHSNTFGRIAAFSPSVMWRNGELFRAWSSRAEHGPKIYLDAGAKEWITLDGVPLPYGEKVAAFHKHLLSLGYGEHELKLVLEPKGEHAEADWARRLPAALEWLLSD